MTMNTKEKQHKNVKELPIIKYGTTPNVLFLGNGINKAFGEMTWRDMIRSISVGEYDDCFDKLDELSYPLQPIVATCDNVHEGIEIISEYLLKKEMLEEHLQYVSSFLQAPYDAILTTNYSYEIEKGIYSDFSCKAKMPSKWRHASTAGTKNENQFGIFKYNEVCNNEYTGRIWHIHGEAARPNSMVFGHYYYGKLLYCIQQYIPRFIRRYKGVNNQGKDFIPLSWIDYFLLGNVYVLGYGMDYSEMDIWWLVNCKKRNFPNEGKVYFYEPEKDKKVALAALAESCGIIIPEIDFDGDFVQYNKRAIKDINENLK